MRRIIPSMLHRDFIEYLLVGFKSNKRATGRAKDIADLESLEGGNEG